MHKLVNPALSFILAVASVAVTVAQSRQAQLTGRWRSTAVSSAGVSAIFEFHGDNQLDSYSAVISDGKYRLIGTDAILLASGSGEEKLELEWDNQDRARIEDEAAGKVTELTRIGSISEKQNPLVGEWNTTREWNGKKYPARASFFSDGKVTWIANLRTEHGSYSLQGGNIRLEIAGRPVVNGGFVLTGNTLTLPNPQGSASSFERF